MHREKCTAGPESECNALAPGQPPHTKSGGTKCNRTPRWRAQRRAAVCLRARIHGVCSRRAIITQQKKGGSTHIFLSSRLWLKISRVIFLVCVPMRVKPSRRGVKLLQGSQRFRKTSPEWRGGLSWAPKLTVKVDIHKAKKGRMCLRFKPFPRKA